MRRTQHWLALACLGLIQAIPSRAQVPFSPVVFDFQLDPGDQGHREGALDLSTRRAEAQLLVSQAPELYGWSVTIEYDPTQVRYVADSFAPGEFLPGFVPLVDQSQEGVVQVGGADLDQVLASGEGELGRLQFELAEGAATPAQLKISRVQFRRPDTTDDLQVEALAALFLPPAPPEAPAVELLSLGGAEALTYLTEHRACPGCDLRQAELFQAELQGVDLRQADLREAVLLKADLRRADLRRADLRQANLLQADLREANLAGADLREARLGGAKLQGASFAGAVLDTFKLQGLNLTGAIWVDGRVCDSGSFNRCK